MSWSAKVGIQYPRRVRLARPCYSPNLMFTGSSAFADDDIGGGWGMYRDLREFIVEIEKLGALRHVAGADTHVELGGITEVAAGLPECPALLFDKIKGFPAGVRVFTNATTTPQRAALALGLDPALRPLDALKAWMAKRQTLKAHKPVTVKDAPFLENSMRGTEVDLGTLPA